MNLLHVAHCEFCYKRSIYQAQIRGWAAGLIIRLNVCLPCRDKEHSIFAEQYATWAHEGQFRRDGVTQYIEHPRAVAGWLSRRLHSDKTVAAAWLHDVLEDTKMGIADMIRAEIPADIAEAVVLLSKNLFDSDVGEYLAKLKCDDIARQVKIADMICNLADCPTEQQIKNYTKRLAYLLS